MGLSPNDPRPVGITLEDAYSEIRKWYQSNVKTILKRGNEYAKNSEELIKKLPPVKSMTKLEIRAIMGEIIFGYLEWAYHESNGKFKMAAYAHASLEVAGLSYSLNDNEKQELKGSFLWPFLFINRN
jgi:hypothetical protein